MSDVRCPACETALPQDAAFCFRCGRDVPAAPAPEDERAAAEIARLQRAIGDRYTIRRAVGAGATAHVYEAADPRHQRRVAIKVLKRELAATVGAERFLLEIETAARLNHPHVLPIHDSGNADGVLYYVMPLVEGETLRDRLRREGRLSIDEAIRLAREVAAALDYAHRQNIVHRDIKPGNVLLQAGHALVTDFGIARALKRSGEGLTDIGHSVGTPQYMSPEQALGESDVDGRTDIYAVGTMLYEMLTGALPFDGDTAQAIFARKVTHAPAPIDAAGLGVPAVLERVVKRAMATDPGDRYPTAAEFVEALLFVDMNVLTEGVRSALADKAAVPAAMTPSEQRRVAVTAGVGAAAGLGVLYAMLDVLGQPPWLFGIVAATVAVGALLGHVRARRRHLRRT